MLRKLTIPVPLLIVAVVAIACNGGSSSPTPGATLTPEATSAVSETPTPDATAAADNTPVPQPTYTPDPSLAGLRITPPDDLDAFLEQFAGMDIVQDPCTVTAPGQRDCGEHGIYLPDPPPAENVPCDIVLADGEPALLLCTVEQPSSLIYYEIP
ncbi:MAG: hypothetical protein HY334_01610 [Armatimonadetes bacterium]|nr:hypothetical protein [Armatimonadota bacterium]